MRVCSTLKREIPLFVCILFGCLLVCVFVCCVCLRKGKNKRKILKRIKNNESRRWKLPVNVLGDCIGVSGSSPSSLCLCVCVCPVHQPFSPKECDRVGQQAAECDRESRELDTFIHHWIYSPRREGKNLWLLYCHWIQYNYDLTKIIYNAFVYVDCAGAVLGACKRRAYTTDTNRLCTVFSVAM